MVPQVRVVLLSRAAGNPDSRGVGRRRGRKEKLDNEQERMKPRSEKLSGIRKGLTVEVFPVFFPILFG